MLPALEPVLLDVSDESSFTGESSDSGIDALIWEVDELLETEALLDEIDRKKYEKTPAESCSLSDDMASLSEDVYSMSDDQEVPNGEKITKKRIKTCNSTENFSKKSKSVDEDDVKREIRMARNRASAERTRLRRLEHVKNLELDAKKFETENQDIISILKKTFDQSDKVIQSMISVVPAVPIACEPIVRRSRARKGDAQEAISKLEKEAANLSPEEVARLRKEARMARNRASAERTRLRRLEAARELEIRTATAKAINENLRSLLQQLLSDSSIDMEKQLIMNAYFVINTKLESSANLCTEAQVLSDVKETVTEKYKEWTAPKSSQEEAKEKAPEQKEMRVVLLASGECACPLPATVIRRSAS